MSDYNWYMVKKALKEFQVESSWPSSSALLRLGGPHNYVIMEKSNNMRPEYVDELLTVLDIDKADFETAYRAASAQV